MIVHSGFQQQSNRCSHSELQVQMRLSNIVDAGAGAVVVFVRRLLVLHPVSSKLYFGPLRRPISETAWPPPTGHQVIRR